MFERFSNASRHTVVLAQREARRLHHAYIGTEHELLGLLAVGDPVVDGAVAGVITLESARAAVEAIIGRGDEVPSGHIPFTPRAKKVLELSLREALRLRHRSIQPGHVFLGLLREGEGVGAEVLSQAGLDFDKATARVVAELDRQPDEPTPGTEPPTVETGPEQVLASLAGGSTDAAVSAVRTAAADAGGIPTPWTLLRAIAEGETPAASLLAGLDLTSPAPPPTTDPAGAAFLHVFDRARGLARGLGPFEAVEPRTRVDVLHLLAVLLTPGEGGVAEHLTSLGADPAALRRQVLAQL